MGNEIPAQPDVSIGLLATPSPERVYAVSYWGEPFLIVREIERRTAKMLYLAPERERSGGSNFAWIKQLPIDDAHFTPDEAWSAYITERETQLQNVLRTVNQLRSQIGQAKRARRREGVASESRTSGEPTDESRS